MQLSNGGTTNGSLGEAKLAACQQTKVWFPAPIKNVPVL